MLRTAVLLLAVFAGLFSAGLPATAQEQAIVTVVRPDKMQEVVLGAVPSIYIDGPLTKETVTKFTAAVTGGGIARASVLLNSPGGSLLAGIDLGKAIRKYGFDTYVGQRSKTDYASGGGCYSACVFAYAGGVYRYVVKDSKIGVHRFSSAATAASDLDMAQILSAAITNHLTAMGVDVALFERMVQAPADGIILLTAAERKQWRLVNDGVSLSW